MGELAHLEDFKPRISGIGRCILCGYEYNAVAPEGVILPMECGKCGCDGVYFKHIITGREDDLLFTCRCNCDVFVNGPENFRCVKCGLVHEYSEIME